MIGLAVDTSVALPLIIENHDRHHEIADWWRGRTGALSGQALVETYAVATRLPSPMRLTARDAARLITARFTAPLVLAASTSRRLPEILAERDLAGGAVYDALVALAAIEHGRVLATRDERARGTYEAMGAEVVVAG